MIENPLEAESTKSERRPLRPDHPRDPRVRWFTLSFPEHKTTKSEMKRRDSHGKKYLLRPGRLYAEIAVVRMLKDADWNAVWIDDFRNKIWADMPRRNREVGLPKRLDLYNRIRETNGGEDAGCWDIWAWNETRGRQLFIEAKRRGHDEVTRDQVRWFEAARSVDVPARRFCVAEWDFEGG